MTGKRFVAYVVKSSLAAYLALGVVMNLAALFLLWLTFQTGDPRAALAGILALLFFGPVLINLAGLMLLKGPVLEMDDTGFRWRRWSDDLIPWSAIARAEIRPQRVASVLCLWLADPGRYPASTFLRMPFQFGRRSGYGDLGLYVQATDCSFDEMIDAVHRFAPQLAAR